MSRLDKFVDHARDPKGDTWIPDSACWKVDEEYGFDSVNPAIDIAQAIQTKPIEEVLCLDSILS